MDDAVLPVGESTVAAAAAAASVLGGGDDGTGSRSVVESEESRRSAEPEGDGRTLTSDTEYSLTTPSEQPVAMMCLTGIKASRAAAAAAAAEDDSFLPLLDADAAPGTKMCTFLAAATPACLALIVLTLVVVGIAGSKLATDKPHT